MRFPRLSLDGVTSLIGAEGEGKMKRLFSLVLLLMIPISAHAQAWSGIISSGRAIDWSTAGIPGGIPNRTTICATINASTYGNGSGDATSGIQSALNTCPNGQVVSLSTGTFLINGNLNIPSNATLRGQGANLTILNAKGTSGNVVNLGTGGPNLGSLPSISIAGGTAAGSTSITLISTSGLSVGEHLLINELNDSFVSIAGSEGSCTWCDSSWSGTRAAGQIVEITSISGTTVGINPGLFMAYPLTPLVTPIANETSYAGVENLQVYANSTGYTNNFKMSACNYCWISGVEGNYADGNHVETQWSYRGEIVNSYFSNAYSHGPGNTDADVDIASSSTGMLVQNNILERLHVSAMLEWGAAGNVIAYNYMFGNFQSSATNFLIMNLDTHGAHPMYNLFEGNIGSKFELDSIWGSSSDNTLFRNWSHGTTKICNPMTGRGAVSCAGSNGWWGVQAVEAVSIDFLATTYNLVGDVIGSSEMASLNKGNVSGNPMGQVDTAVAVCGPSPCGSGSRSYDSDAYAYTIGYGNASDTGGGTYDSLTPYTTLFLHGEYSNVTGTTTWANGVTHTLPASFYLSSKPAWFGSVPWPPIGPDVAGGPGPGGHTYAIPAEVCYEKVMGGTDGTGSPLSFNANACYTATAAPASPTNLSGIVQ
jgi:hypothetical protein